METKFQTSFIPRKPVPVTPGSLGPQVQHHGRGLGSVYMTLAVLVFVASLLVVGGAYAWKQYLISDQAKLQTDLAQRQKDFNLDQIALMKAQSTKISMARQLLKNHLAVSNIFDIVGKLTAESVRFVTMDLTVPAGMPGPFQISMSGYGRNYSSVAFQSDVLSQLERYGLRNVVKNAIISNPALNPNGSVSFSFTAQVDPASFSYMKSLGAAPVQAGGASATTTSNN